MILIGLKKGVFSINEVVALIYGPIVNRRWMAKDDNFRSIPISYRKELVKKMDSSVLTDYALCLMGHEGYSIALRKVNCMIQWDAFLEELNLWMSWGVKFDDRINLEVIKSGIEANIWCISTVQSYSKEAVRLLVSAGMPESEAEYWVETRIYYDMMS